MRISVRHETTYRFDPPRARVIQSHRLTPSAHAGQKPLSWEVRVDGALFGSGFTDGAGDLVRTMTLDGPVSEMLIEVTGEVDTTDTVGVLRGHREIVSPRVYLRRTRMTAPGVALTALSDRLGAPATALQHAHDMAGLVAESVIYTPGATDQGMTASEVLELGHGVCQDHAQVLIALARMRETPARYVHGYLFADADGSAHEASHAWAELWVEDLGWVGFDPANRCCPDDRYIRVGSGLDALDAAPIRGISLGGGTETMDIAVSVAASQQ
ncbi:transglutaminase family protein [Halovulum dunhuangense]|uniref:Transglutaminase family protein n=1 Tax=Halovulum dunhuangense TaxID=1505036 RepID=A0A849L086_9RHOB|nr:transglutaminase family protein [Halovulum dunhuangense]NNU79540.1 transglutaminase family protein [Halovulum dunhuangense]